jgi:hypothetical protein
MSIKEMQKEMLRIRKENKLEIRRKNIAVCYTTSFLLEIFGS